MPTSPDRGPDEPAELPEDALLAAAERAEPRATAGSIEARPVDQVAVTSDGGCDYLDPSQWVSLSRRERLALIRSDSVRFLHHGDQVPLRSALVYLRSYAAGLTSAKRKPSAITTRSTRMTSPGRFPPPRHSRPPPP
jgi:hypothetical protein